MLLLNPRLRLSTVEITEARIAESGVDVGIKVTRGCRGFGIGESYVAYEPTY